MGYEDILRRIEDIDLEISKSRNSINSNDAEIQRFKQLKINSDRNLEGKIDSLRKQDLAKQKAEKTNEYSIKLEKIANKRADIKTKYEQDKSKLTADNLSKKYEGSKINTSEISETLNEVKQAVIDLMGERFQKELYSQLDEQRIKINPEDLSKLKKKFQAKTKELKIFLSFAKYSKSERIVNLKEKLNHITTPFKDEKEGDEDKVRKTVIIYSVVALLLSYMVMYYFAVALLIVVFILMLLNVYKNSRVYSLVLECKLVEDNINAIDSKIKEKVEKELEKKQKDLDDRYKSNMDKLDALDKKINDSLTSELSRIEDNHAYDDTEVLKENANTIKTYDNNIVSLEHSNADIQNRIKKLQVTRDELNVELKSVIDETIKEYIDYTKTGKAQLLDFKFLLDYNEDGIEFFNHPAQGVLYIAQDNIEEYVNLFKLMIVQLYRRYTPSAVHIDLLDLDRAGADFRTFQTEGLSDNFKFYVESNTIDNFNKNLPNKYLEAIRVLAGKDIQTYNEDSISIGGYTKTYNFIFKFGVDDSELKNKTYRRIYVDGGSYGLYLNTVVNVTEIKGAGKDMVDFLNSIKYIYGINNGRLQPIQREVLIELANSEEK